MPKLCFSTQLILWLVQEAPTRHPSSLSLGLHRPTRKQQSFQKDIRSATSKVPSSHLLEQSVGPIGDYSANTQPTGGGGGGLALVKYQKQ